MLWNIFYEKLLPISSSHQGLGVDSKAEQVWHHLRWRIDAIPWDGDNARKVLARHWFEAEWPEFFDLIEFSAAITDVGSHRRDRYEFLNWVLESEGCAYRFISGELAPLTNPTELAAVTMATECAIPAAAKHIRDALQFMPPAKDPSPRNSVKESISAVEAALKHLVDDAGADLGQGLKAFEKQYGKIHGALSGGLEKLYGYTSDASGIRHALSDEKADTTLDDARFMVVTCSAFVNYLIALASAPRK